MSITVTTPTGNIGRALTDMLLKSGETVTIIARQPEKVAHFAERGATVIEGTHSDERTVLKATEGADAFFVLTPPDFGTTDLRALYRRFGTAAARAIKDNGIPHVVHLSSIGADLDAGTGPVLGLHDNEALLAAVATNIVQLRAGYFMENTLWQVPAIKSSQSLFSTFSGGTRIPMVATRDIAARAADLLLHREWRGHRVVELQGPEEVSYDDVASILSKTLGRPVSHVTVTPEQSKASFVGMGATAHIADLFNELSTGIDRGQVTFHEARNGNTKTPTSYAIFAKEVFQPAFERS